MQLEKKITVTNLEAGDDRIAMSMGGFPSTSKIQGKRVRSKSGMKTKPPEIRKLLRDYTERAGKLERPSRFRKGNFQNVTFVSQKKNLLQPHSPLKSLG